jgi:hypothetical protein
LRNAKNYAEAKSEYAVGMAKARSDPAAAQIWPMLAAVYQQAVDSAHDALVSADANKVEHAIRVLKTFNKESQK